MSPTAIEQQLETVGYRVNIDDAVAAYEANQEQVDDGLHGIVTGTLEIVGGIPAIVFGLTVTMFVPFGLLRDGNRLAGWLQTVVPISDTSKNELFAELDRLMWASVIGNVINRFDVDRTPFCDRSWRDVQTLL